MAFSRRGAGPRDGGPSSVFWGCCVVLQCFRLAEEAPGVWFGSAAGREQCGVSDRPWQASPQRQERLKANGDPPVASAGIVALPCRQRRLRHVAARCLRREGAL